MSKSPKSRRARGTGSIFRSETHDCWIGRATVGGRRREVRAPTQREVIAKLAALRPPGPETTVEDWAARWLAGCGVRPGTLADYSHTVARYVVPTLGRLLVRDLTTFHVEAAAARWAESLGPNTLRKNLRTLRAMLTAARRAKLVTENVAADARQPRPQKVRIDPFTPAELAAVVAEAGRRPNTRLFALLASVGCRLGEALGLNVADFDPVAGSVTIRRTYSRKHGEGPPKSDRGCRTCRVPADALPALAAAVGGRRSGPLFTSEAGGRQHESTVRSNWGRLLKRLRLRYRNPHQLRHSVATAMISAGVPVGDAAKYLGDNPETIVRTYLHPTGADPAAAMERLFRGS